VARCTGGSKQQTRVLPVEEIDGCGIGRAMSGEQFLRLLLVSR
jgi:hypothetical protein